MEDMLFPTFLFLLIAWLFPACRHKLCGTKSPSRQEKALADGRQNILLTTRRHLSVGTTCEELCDQCIVVETYFHFMGITLADGQVVIPYPASAVERFVSKGEGSVDDFTTREEVLSMVDAQMEVLNTHFAGTPFFFEFMECNETKTFANTQWTGAILDYFPNISSALGRGGLKSLNVYLTNDIQGEQLVGFEDTLVGFASLPSYQLDRSGDGIFLRYDSLPGGGLDGFDLGYTLVHEVGHFFGLLHVFENDLADKEGNTDPCQSSNRNDLVDDTPVMEGPTYLYVSNCSALLDDGEDDPAFPDTCPDLPGLDPVFNFMNYLDSEVCFQERGSFSCGQIERMHRQWLLYREMVDLCDEGELLFEMVLTFDKAYHARENSFFLTSVTDGTRIIDSDRDYESPGECGTIEQDLLVIDLCIPRGGYTFTFLDSFGDGLGEGASVEVILDGSFHCKIEGNFGSRAVIEFSNQTRICPENPPSESLPDTTGKTKLSIAKHCNSGTQARRSTPIFSRILASAILWWAVL